MKQQLGEENQIEIEWSSLNRGEAAVVAEKEETRCE